MVSEGLPIFMPPCFEVPVLWGDTTSQQVPTTLEDGYDIFKPFDEDFKVFRTLRCFANPTWNFIPKSCKRWWLSVMLRR